MTKKQMGAIWGAMGCQTVFLLFYGIGMYIYVARRFVGMALDIPFALVSFLYWGAALPMLCAAMTPVLLLKSGLFAFKGARRGLFFNGLAVTTVLLLWQLCATLPPLRPASPAFVYIGTYLAENAWLYFLPMQWMAAALLAGGQKETRGQKDIPDKEAA